MAREVKHRWSFVGGTQGQWQVSSIHAVKGESLPLVPRLWMLNQPAELLPDRGAWVLEGFTSNVRYAERSEITQLKAVQEGLKRPASTSAACIPMKKSAQWWA